MGGANYLKMSRQIINAWKTAFTNPTKKQRCLERATQLGRSHTFDIVAMIKSRILAATIQVGYSYHPVSVTLCTIESGTAGHSIKKRDSPAKNGTVGRYASGFSIGNLYWLILNCFVLHDVWFLADWGLITGVCMPRPSYVI